MKIVLPVFILLLSVNLLSCFKKCPCHSHRINLNYIGFLPEETDTIIIRRYKPGTGFTVLVDSGIIHRLNTGYFYHTDTLLVWNYIDTLAVKSGYDYELFLPGVNKINRVHEIREELTEAGCLERNLHGCFNRLISIKLDGQLYPADPQNPGLYFYH